MCCECNEDLRHIFFPRDPKLAPIVAHILILFFEYFPDSERTYAFPIPPPNKTVQKFGPKTVLCFV